MEGFSSGPSVALPPVSPVQAEGELFLFFVRSGRAEEEEETRASGHMDGRA